MLEGKGIRCWIAPRDILPGMTWGKAILEAINCSRLMVLVFSSHSNGSGQVMREVERAVHKGIPILPLRIENVSPTEDMEYFLSTTHWLDVMHPPLEQHLEHVVGVANQLLSSGKTTDTTASTLKSHPSTNAGAGTPQDNRSGVNKTSRRRLIIMWITSAFAIGASLAIWIKIHSQQTEVPVAQASVDEQVNWDFEYGYRHVFESHADDHLINIGNAKKYSELQSPQSSYWGPSANDIEATLTYRFDFPSPAACLFVKANIHSFNFSNGGGRGIGAGSLWASRDGINWVVLLENPAGPGMNSHKTYEQNLPKSLLGAKQLWLQIKMNARGAPNIAYTVAQFSRSTSSATENIFEVKAQYVDQ